MQARLRASALTQQNASRGFGLPRSHCNKTQAGASGFRPHIAKTQAGASGFRPHTAKTQARLRASALARRQNAGEGCSFISGLEGGILFGLEAGVEEGGEVVAVEVAADKDELYHAVAVDVVPVAFESGFAGHEELELFFRGGGIPVAGFFY